MIIHDIEEDIVNREYKTQQFELQLKTFHEKLSNLAISYDCTMPHTSKMEATIDDYSKFITDDDYKEAWEKLEQQMPDGLDELVSDIRKTSALCVAISEKYRAVKLLNGEDIKSGYFNNIESCIEEEFGSFRVTSESKVLLVGSGSFPMTPLLIARETGAEVIGIDIDEEAVVLGRKVVDRLGNGLKIRLEKVSLEEIDDVKEVTHIIFSSTVAPKYEMLDQLHSLTNERVVVAMRYGDQLKSLFNYPMMEVDENKWKLVENIRRPKQVFDIALYAKT